MDEQTAVTQPKKSPFFIFLGLLIMVALIGLVFYALILFLNRGRVPISLTPGNEQPGIINSFDECFNAENTTVYYAKTPGDVAKCVTEDGKEFFESQEKASSRFEVNANLYGPVSSWAVYTDPQKRFTFRYPEQRFEVVSEVKYWNRSAVALKQKGSADGLYAFAVETPKSREEAELRLLGKPEAKILEVSGQILAPVIISKNDPFLAAVLESFEVLQ